MRIAMLGVEIEVHEPPELIEHLRGWRDACAAPLALRAERVDAVFAISLRRGEEKTPPERGFLVKAADGIRTHDLLHGKQTL